MVITFLTDFGLQDDFVGTCHGVIARIAPDARVIDVTHGIAPQAILQGAIVLRNTVQFMPVGVHLAVVDPDVGGDRRAVAVRTADGRAFVGPDNGLLVVAADGLGIVAAHELTDGRYRLPEVSRTFHARDVFAPAAAHIAAGVPLEELGPWTWVLVRSQDWKPISRMLRLNPESPAFTALEPRETFLEEALFLHDPLRTAELMEEWQRSMPKLLELAVTHELGHAICEEPNEAAADHIAEELRKGRLMRCRISTEHERKSVGTADLDGPKPNALRAP